MSGVGLVLTDLLDWCIFFVLGKKDMAAFLLLNKIDILLLPGWSILGPPFGTAGLLKKFKFTTKGGTVKLVWPCPDTENRFRAIGRLSAFGWGLFEKTKQFRRRRFHLSLTIKYFREPVSTEQSPLLFGCAYAAPSKSAPNLRNLWLMSLPIFSLSLLGELCGKSVA